MEVIKTTKAMIPQSIAESQCAVNALAQGAAALAVLVMVHE